MSRQEDHARQRREAEELVQLKDGAPEGSELGDVLEETWKDPPGLWAWF
jgi:hypothetical protein